MALKSSKLLQDARFKLRQLHLAYSTEKSYVRRIESSLAVERKVAANTQLRRHLLARIKCSESGDLGSSEVGNRKVIQQRRGLQNAVRFQKQPVHLPSDLMRRAMADQVLA